MEGCAKVIGNVRNGLVGDMFGKYPELAVYLALGVGYWVGGLKFRGVSLGGTGPAIRRLARGDAIAGASSGKEMMAA
jgi:hypothetical protein